MKKCYCGQENEDSAINCVACGGAEFMGRHKKVEPAESKAPVPNLPAPQKENPASLTVFGAFRLRDEGGAPATGGRTVASSMGGIKKGFLLIEGARVVLKQRLTGAGGFVLGATCIVAILLMLALPEYSTAGENAKAVVAMVLLAGTLVIPLFCALWVRRFAKEFNLADIRDAVVHGEELELHLQPAPTSASAPAVTLVFKPRPADLSRLTQFLSASGVKVRDAGQQDMMAFQESLLAATPRAWVTISLMVMNVLIFVAVMFSDHTGGSSAALLAWGADYGPLTVNCQQWWRLLACCFLHFGILHLLFNMYALFQAGALTERLFGNWFFLVIYLGCGLVGSLASLWVHPSVISVGASGAIFGVFGALLGWLAREGGGIPRRVAMPVLTSAIAFVIWNLFNGLMNMMNQYSATVTNSKPAEPAIDMAAHCGGLVCGFILGFLAARPLGLGDRRPLALSRSVALLAGICVVAGLLFIPVLQANRPDVARMKMLAGSFYNGDVVARNREKSLYWFKQAAQAGDVDSQNAIGTMYFSGDGVEKDPATGVQWFTKAAEQGDINAEKFLMQINFAGQGVPTNYIEGIKWLTKIADQGGDRDCTNVEKAVGLAYYNGVGLPKDQQQAVKWLKRVADRGDIQAQNALKAIQPAAETPAPGHQWLIRYAALRERDKAEAIMAALKKGSSFEDAAATVGTKPSALRWYKSGELQGPVESALQQLEEGSYVLTETEKGYYVVYLSKEKKGDQ